LIRELDKKGQVQKAEELFERAYAAGVCSDCSSYKDLIRRMLSASNTKKLHQMINSNRSKGTKFFQELRASGNADTYSYNVMIDFSSSEDALLLKKEMESSGVPLSGASWNSIVKALVNDGLFREAEEMLDQMQEEGFEPSPRTIKPLVGALKRVGKRQIAKNIRDRFLQ